MIDHLDALRPKWDGAPELMGATAAVIRANEDLTELSMVALSRYLAETRAKARSGANIHPFSKFLSGYGRTPVKRGRFVLPAPFPDLPTGPFPSGMTPYNRAGISMDEFDQIWRGLLEENDIHAHLEAKLLDFFIPRELWVAAEQAIRDGPGLTAARLQRIVWRECQTVVPPTRARPEGGFVSKSTVGRLVSEARRFFRHLIDLNSLGYPSLALEQWEHETPWPKIPAQPANTNRSAPPRPLVRRVWRFHDEDVRHCLRCSRAAEEVAAVEALGKSALKRSGHRPLRFRAILFVLFVVGARVGAICGLRICDYDPDRLCFDGVRRPALALRPGKSHGDLRRWKVIPPDAAYVIEAYLLFLERRLGRPLDPSWPMFGRGLAHPEVPTSPSVIGNKVSGHGHPGRRDWTTPLVPLDPAFIGVRGANVEGLEPLGYSPHACRSAAFQMARAGARKYAAEEELEIEPEVLGDVLLDHHIPSDTMNYGDVNSEQGREKWAQVAIELNWRMLTSDFGARRVRDEKGLREAIRKRAALETELARVEAAIERGASRISRGLAISGSATDRLEELTAIITSTSVIEELHRHERRLRDELTQTDLEIERIRYDPKRRLVLADDAGAAPGLGTLDALDAVADAEEAAVRRRRRIREWVTLRELAKIAGVSVSAVKRWCDGRLPEPTGHPHNPWGRECVPVDESQGRKRRRIAVAGLKPTFLDAVRGREELDRVLAGWPSGWSVESCEAPLRAPTPAPLENLDHGAKR